MQVLPHQRNVLFRVHHDEIGVAAHSQAALLGVAAKDLGGIGAADFHQLVQGNVAVVHANHQQPEPLLQAWDSVDRGGEIWNLLTGIPIYFQILFLYRPGEHLVVGGRQA